PRKRRTASGKRTDRPLAAAVAASVAGQRGAVAGAARNPRCAIAAGLVTVHALAARLLGLNAALGLHALGYALIENLSMAALKAIPLGQDDGQAMQRRLALRLPQWLER